MNKIIYILFAFIFISCHDSYVNLGDDYVYMNRSIVKQKKKGDVSEVTFLVTPQVLNFNYDDNYIIAFSLPDKDDDVRYWIAYGTTSDIQDSLNMQFEIMKEIGDCYWIIQKKKNKVIGPLTSDEFDRKCREIGVKCKLDSKYKRSFMEHQ